MVHLPYLRCGNRTGAYRKREKLDSKNLPIEKLIAAFQNQWNIPFQDLDEDLDYEGKSLPRIVRFKSPELKKPGYWVLFKSSLSHNPYWVKATKKMLIHPDKCVNLYQLNQLVESRENGKEAQES